MALWRTVTLALASPPLRGSIARVKHSEKSFSTRSRYAAVGFLAG